MPKAITTSQCHRLQGSRSSRAGMSLSTTGGLSIFKDIRVEPGSSTYMDIFGRAPSEKELAGEKGQQHGRGPQEISETGMEMLVIKNYPTGGKHQDKHNPENSGRSIPGIDQQQDEGDKKDRIDPSAEEDCEVIHRFMAQHAHAIRRPRQNDGHVGAQIAGNTSIAGRSSSLFDGDRHGGSFAGGDRAPIGRQKGRSKDHKTDQGDQTGHLHSKVELLST